MNQAQISLDFSPPPKKEEEYQGYEALDIQLAELMERLNGESNKALKTCTLDISKRTREGQIAMPCSTEQEAILRQTKVVGEANEYKPLVLDQGYLYLRRYWQYQQRLAEQLNKRLGQPSLSDEERHWQQERLAFYFEKDELVEGDVNWQQVAAERALNHRFLVLSGGPGTGKTTTITRIMALLIEQYLKDFRQNECANGSSRSDEPKRLKSGGGVNHKMRILLAAPTGKAAIRMLEAISQAQKRLSLSDDVQKHMPTEANTLHKLLGYRHAKVSFTHHADNPLEADLVLIDEASMIDIALMSKLLEAVPPQATLILIGDKNQLASVETGSVFTDMCAGLTHSDQLVTLQKNWRFSADSGIGKLAQAANKGEASTLLSLLKEEAQGDCQLVSVDDVLAHHIHPDLLTAWDVYFKQLTDPQASLQTLFEAFNQYRILCALRRGLNGSQLLNTRIEVELAKQGKINLKKSLHPHQASSTWYHGRPVMITQNDYHKGLFNGDTGITLIKQGKTHVYFPDAKDSTAYKAYSPVRLPAHETTWAMTIHKSQGSEFNQVSLILPHEVMPLLTRQLIYTGITRAKEQVRVIAETDVLQAGVASAVVSATRLRYLLA